MKTIIFLVLALPLVADAQLLEVKQVIYGMDCAPCARGVEASLKRLEGIRSVTISLNNGTAAISLASDNRQTLREIRQRISDNGFTPKDAEVKLSGTLREKNGKFLIETGTGETYAIESRDETMHAFEQLRKSSQGKSVTIAGVVAETKKSPADPWDFRLTNVAD